MPSPNPDDTDPNPYPDPPTYLSILAIFKNETMNLRIWLDHYLWQGVEHFYLIDNGSTDDPLPHLRQGIEEGWITYRSMPERHRQVAHYRRMFREAGIRDRTTWLIVADLDEFFFGVHRPLAETLRGYERYDVVLSHWVMFGTTCDSHPPDIRTVLVERAPMIHPNTKYIVRTCCCSPDGAPIHIHAPETRRRYRSIIEDHVIRLHHYPLQSVEFFTTVKIPRGDVLTSNSDEIRNLSYFDSMNRESQGCHDPCLADLIRHGYP